MTPVGQGSTGELLSVWPTGQPDLPEQLAAGGYLPGTARDTGRMSPAS